MKAIKIIILSAVFAVAYTSAFAQNTNTTHNEEVANIWAEFNEYKNDVWKEYGEYRDKCNREYAEYLEEAWGEVSLQPADTMPKMKKIQPQVFKAEDSSTAPKIETAAGFFARVFSRGNREEFAKPIEEYREITSITEDDFNFTFLGTGLAVRVPDKKPKLKSLWGKHIADLWRTFSKKEDFNNMVFDCLQLKEKHNMCDWAYLKMIQAFASEWYGNNSNEETLLAAFIYTQSGYKIKLGKDDKKMYLLYASNYSIHDEQCYYIDDTRFYVAKNSKDDAGINDFLPDNLHVSKATMKHDTPLSLSINKNLVLDTNSFVGKNLHGKRFPTVVEKVKVNQNLVDFYNNYPRGFIGNTLGSQWVTYANAPISKEASDALYPKLRSSIAGKGTVESLNILLDFVQHAFVYKVDDQVWGTERIFFPDETLTYPYSDCEDRAILFSRIVRDLMQLEVVLIYYPGHLAAAVNINRSDVPGTYVLDQTGTKNYIICDGTYFGASIGEEQPQLRGAPKVIIQL